MYKSVCARARARVCVCVCVGGWVCVCVCVGRALVILSHYYLISHENEIIWSP